MKKRADSQTFFSPARIFILYILAAVVGILGFRFIFPGESPPIAYFSRSWRIVRGLLDLINLFPALAMSALVIPFGRAALEEEEYSSFSPRFFEFIRGPVITAISAAAAYGLLFFLALPLVQDRAANMRAEGGLYRLARERAQTHSQAGEWQEAAQFIDLCERIWPESPEMSLLKDQAAVYLAERQFDDDEERAAAREEAAALRGADLSLRPGQRPPVNVTEALDLAETALAEERFFDAHWLAILAGRIAKADSPEAAVSAQLASQAWTEIRSLAPNARETRLYNIFRLKQSGYEAMVAGDWIRAFYIFQELMDLSPNDPEAAKFFAQSEQGAKEIAFFRDEMELAVGEILTAPVFSLPGSGGPGRVVLRFSSLSSFADYAYGLSLEYISFNGEARPLFRLAAPYAKILPIRVNERSQTLILLRALDRQDRNRRWDPSWAADPALPPAPGSEIPGDTRLLLDIAYEDFLLLAQIRRGLENLQMGELFTAIRRLGSDGYLPQVFEAELLYRLSVPLFFLPFTILALMLGWRFRAKKRPRYLFIPMLPLLPLVFHGLVHLYRNILNTAGIWAVISLGFSTALIVFIAALVLLFIIFLISLAAQHG
jgi:hypothetical protein